MNLWNSFEEFLPVIFTFLCVLIPLFIVLSQAFASRETNEKAASNTNSVIDSAFEMYQKNARIPEGTIPYTPSRLEWLAVEMNARHRVELSEQSGYSMSFVPLEDRNTLAISVEYFPHVDQEVLDNAVNTSKKIISLTAETRGWSSWLQVRERFKKLPALK